MATATETVKSPDTNEPCEWAGREALDEAKRQVRRVLTDIRHNAEDTAAAAELAVRRRPLPSVGIAAGVGAIVGVVAGFVAGWSLKAPRS